MLVLLSPSKTLKPSPCPLGERALIVPTGLQDAMVTMDVLRLWSPSRIQEAMKVSPTLAAKVALWHEQWTPASNHAAGWTFQGDAFKSLDMGSFDGSGVNAAQTRLRILHGLYGMLKPSMPLPLCGLKWAKTGPLTRRIGPWRRIGRPSSRSCSPGRSTKASTRSS